MIGSPKLFPYGPSYFVAVYWAEVDQEEGEVVCETHDDSNGNDESSSSNSSSSSSSSSSALILQQVSSYIGNGSSSSSDGWQQQPFAGKWMLLCTWKDMVQKNAANVSHIGIGTKGGGGGEGCYSTPTFLSWLNKA